MSGFLPIPRKAQDLTRRRFGRLVVEGIVEVRAYPPPPAKCRSTHVVWLCKCDCGNITKVTSGRLRNGQTMSCGCLNAILTQHRSTTHGHGGRNASPEYRSWCHLIDRCENPNSEDYANYGGRGIRVCERWRNSFEAFLEDMGERPSPKHSIDREDVNGHYEKSNCRWATASQQSRNRRPFIGRWGSLVIPTRD